MSTPAGWYDDGSGRQRWWDGQQWTEHFAPTADAPVDADAGAQPVADAQPAADLPAADLPGADLPGAGFDATVSATAPDENPTQAYPPSDYTAPGFAAPSAPGYADVNATAAYPGAYQAPTAGQPYGAYAPTEPTGPRKTPVLGFIGLALAVIGTILACIPTPITFGIGLFVLFAALVVSIIALFIKNTKKWPSITGLILSVVGGIAGIVIFTIAAILWVGDVASGLPSGPSDGTSSEGRPSTEEVADGIEDIIDTTGMTGELSDEQIICYADYFIASDIPDETLWVIASGDDALTDAAAVREFSEKLASGTADCLTP